MHEQFLMISLAKARERSGYCFPNPAVGAVIVHQGNVVVQENHYAWGAPHAEQNAIESFLKQGFKVDESTTLYVTLEPCNHWGKTPPCTSAIVESGIKKVIYAYKDPNPLVSQKDTEQLLRDQGIECKAVRVEAIDRFYEPYYFWTKTRRPFVTFKIAQSLDGKIAKEGGSPVALSKEPLTSFTHNKRNSADALLTSATTILNDDPQLNVRLVDKIIAKPIIVLDSKLRLSGQERIFKTARKVYLLHSDKITPNTQYENTQLVALPLEKELFSLKLMLEFLGKEFSFHHLFVEAGGTLFASFLAEKMINRAYVYVVPTFLGSNGVSVYSGNEAIHLTDSSYVTGKQYDNQWLYQFEFVREV